MGAYPKLRVCNACKFIFTMKEDGVLTCPLCGGRSSGAFSTYRIKAYIYKRTQEPYLKKKLEHTLRDALRQAMVLAPKDADTLSMSTVKFKFKQS